MLRLAAAEPGDQRKPQTHLVILPKIVSISLTVFDQHLPTSAMQHKKLEESKQMAWADPRSPDPATPPRATQAPATTAEHDMMEMPVTVGL